MAHDVLDNSHIMVVEKRKAETMTGRKILADLQKFRNSTNGQPDLRTQVFSWTALVLLTKDRRRRGKRETKKDLIGRVSMQWKSMNI